METSLRELKEALQEKEDALRKSHEALEKTHSLLKATWEKVFMDNKYLNVVDTRYKCMQVYFENDLAQMQLLHSSVKISRKQIHVEQEIVGGRLVPPSNKLTS